MTEFKVISYKRGRRAVFDNPDRNSEVKSVGITNCITRDKIIQRIQSAKEDIAASTFYTELIETLQERIKNLQHIDIISYSLGQFTQCVTSRYQFAFLLLLKKHCNSKVHVYDPVFTPDEKAILEYCGCKIIDCNEEGKRKADSDTIFFLPHCPKQLINNLLWKNWKVNLSKLIIIGNSFTQIVESHSDRFLKENLSYVFRASSFVTELKISNSFKFTDIFNDLSLHLFLEENINNSPDFDSVLATEPVYKEEDIEFVTDSLSNSLNLSEKDLSR